MKRTDFTQKQRKPMARKAKNQRQPKSATGPMLEPWRIDAIHALPCAACGCSGPCEAHHSKDRPPADLRVYRYFPGYGEKSADADAIPLCQPCHAMFHTDHGEFARRYGPDYQYIPQTRAEIEPMEIDY